MARDLILILICSSILSLVACDDPEKAARLARAKDASCNAHVALQYSAKGAGETLERRMARIAEVQAQCDPETYGEALRADEEAAIAWLKELSDRPGAE